MGPRTFCFHFLKKKKNLLGFVFNVCFIFLTLNGIPLLHRIAYRLSKRGVSESGAARAKTLSVRLFTMDWTIVILVTGDSAFILPGLTEETSGTFHDGKTHDLNEGSYECVYMYMYISLYLHIYIKNRMGQRTLQSERIDCEMGS